MFLKKKTQENTLRILKKISCKNLQTKIFVQNYFVFKFFKSVHYHANKPIGALVENVQVMFLVMEALIAHVLVDMWALIVNLAPI